MYYIYEIHNTVTDVRYIGLTIEPDKRKRWHFNALKRGDHINPHLQNSFNKHGRKSFKFKVIEQNIEGDNFASQREQYWIAYHGLKNVYNIN